MDTDEPLETGASAATPPGDNLCNDYAQGLAECFAALAEARGDRIDADDTVAMGDGGSASLFGNVAVVRRPIDESAWPALAERMQAFYRGRPGGSFLVFSAWPTPDLRPFDFGRVGHPPLMFRPAAPVQDEPIADFEIRPVTDAASARDWEDALVHGYPEPALQPFEAGCFLPARASPRRAGVTGSATCRVSSSVRRRRSSATTTSTSSSSRRSSRLAVAASAGR